MFPLHSIKGIRQARWVPNQLQLGKLCKHLSSQAVVLFCLSASVAKATDLSILSNTNDFIGPTTEFSNPDGVSCRINQGEKASLMVGGGFGGGRLIPGIASNDFYNPARLSDPQPVAGIVLRLPLGGKVKGCDEFIAIESAMSRFNKAQELFDAGVITQEQLELIASRAYQVLSSF